MNDYGCLLIVLNLEREDELAVGKVGQEKPLPPCFWPKSLRLAQVRLD